MKDKIAELLARTYTQGTIVWNCFPHGSLPITDRPSNCERCMADIRNTLDRALRVNEWLNAWKVEAETLLREAAGA